MKVHQTHIPKLILAIHKASIPSPNLFQKGLNFVLPRSPKVSLVNKVGLFYWSEVELASCFAEIKKSETANQVQALECYKLKLFQDHIITLLQSLRKGNRVHLYRFFCCMLLACTSNHLLNTLNFNLKYSEEPVCFLKAINTSKIRWSSSSPIRCSKNKDSAMPFNVFSAMRLPPPVICAGGQILNSMSLKPASRSS